MKKLKYLPEAGFLTKLVLPLHKFFKKLLINHNPVPINSMFNPKPVYVKKLLFVAFLFFIANYSFSQTQYNSNPKPDKYHENIFAPLKGKYPCPGDLSVSGDRVSNEKSLTWKWDTIVSFDTDNNYYERYTRSFDYNGTLKVYIAEKWQGNLWVNSYRRTYTYDADGNKLSQLYEFWQNDAWTYSERTNYTYDVNGYMQTYVTELFQNNAWINKNTGSYTYDLNGNILTYLFEEWKDGSWLNSLRYTCTYDANSNMLTYLLEQWKYGAWANMMRHTYTFDANSHMLTYLSELCFGGSWTNDYQVSFNYDGNGYLSDYLYEDWQNGTWVNWKQAFFTCDNAGNILTEVYEEWNSGLWININRKSYTYDPIGNVLSCLIENSQCSGQWANEERYSYTYDLSGNLLSDLNERWIDNEWINNEAFSYNHDLNGNSINGECLVYNDGSWLPNNEMLDVYTGNTISDNVFGYRYTAKYTSVSPSYVITGISESSEDVAISIYPNPASDFVNIENLPSNAGNNTTVSVYDNNGHLALQQLTQQSTLNINISQLSHGMYFMRIESSDGIIEKKFVKE